MRCACSSAAGPVGSPLEQRRARQAEHQHRHVAVDCRQVVEEVERAVVGPVQIVEQQHDGRAVLGRRPGGTSAPPRGSRGCGSACRRRVMPSMCGLSAKSSPIRWPSRWAWACAMSSPSSRRTAARCLARSSACAASMLSLSAICKPPGQDVAQQAVGLALRLRTAPGPGRARSASGWVSAQFSNS